MEHLIKLYSYIDGVNDIPFPNEEEQVIITSFKANKVRMGGIPTISATVKHRLCLDDLWNDNVYGVFDGEKYFTLTTPSSYKDNTDTRYVHTIELMSERNVLNNVMVVDAVQDDDTEDTYKSNSTKVVFSGDIHEFAKRMNAALAYSKLKYKIVVDENITTEEKNVSFEDKYFLSALQEGFNIYEIPFYFDGTTIHYGYTSNAVTYPFKYGHDEALLSIKKNNANYAVINRITGIGSSDNIPFYYPNESADREAIIASGKKWITPSQSLMPPVYRESEGAERFYNAVNGIYASPDGGYYDFENPYTEKNRHEAKVDFTEIKPTITGMTNANGVRIDMFQDIAYDLDDNDETDEEGNYLHPYFFVKLPKFDGDNGFNLFDHAIENQPMQISMTSGICSSCVFEVAVGEETQKNIVQVDVNGELKRDEDGNVVRTGAPQEIQNDTSKYSVWLALKKDDATYSSLVPNKNIYLQPSVNDTFVILGINLPTQYIQNAENKLRDSLIKHMYMNNVEKFTFSITFSRVFFHEHPEILAQINENARVLIEYNGKQHTLYVENFNYVLNDGDVLPEIQIDLVDTLSVGKSSSQTIIDSVKQDILSSVGGGDTLKQGLKYFLRKDTADRAQGKITFTRGIDIGTYAANTSGGTFRPLADGTTYTETDRLRVRVKAYFETLEIINTNSVGGKMILTPAGGVTLREVVDREPTFDDEGNVNGEKVWDFYRCYFLAEQDGQEIENRYHVGDLALSESFNIKEGVSTSVSNHYYWREVVGIGKDYIDLSKTKCDEGSDVPQAQDVVCHLGNRTDTDRQGAIIFSSVDVMSPSITLYQGINDFSLTDKDYVAYGVDKTTNKAYFRVYGEMYMGDRDGDSYVKYSFDNGVEIKGRFVNRGGDNIEDLINNIQNQVDGAIETWFYDPVPTLTNEPAVNWETDNEKNNHLGDLYYSGDGKAYRFQKEGSNYVWKLLQDSDITKALAEAAKALNAANQAQEDANEAAERLNRWAADGVISPTEKQSIKDEIARIDADKANINNEYAKYSLGIPTAFNTAYNKYREQLVKLSASTPENITIPSDFSDKQTTYYTQRTTALGAISDAAKKLTENANAEAIKAQQQATEAISAAQNAQNTADGLKNFTDEAFKDGIIDRAEATAIEKYINAINETRKNVDGTYQKLIDNPYLDDENRETLTSAYNAFVSQSDQFVSTINTAIKDGIVSSEEKTTVDNAYEVYSDRVTAYNVAVENINQVIQNVLKGYSDAALEKAEEALGQAQAAQTAAENIQESVTNLNNYIDGAFKDGIIDDAEKIAIEKYLNTVNQTKQSVDGTFETLYGNAFLTGTAKSNLKSAYDTLTNKIASLISVINKAIDDDVATPEESSDVDAAYDAFSEALKNYNKAVELANKAIQDALKGFSDEALEVAQGAAEAASKAQDAANKANTAVTNLNNCSRTALLTMPRR